MLVHTDTTWRAHRLGVEHVVEGGGAEHLGRGDPDQAGDVDHGLGGEPPVLLLGQVAEGDEGRAGLGVQGDRSGGLGSAGLRREVGTVAACRADAAAARPTGYGAARSVTGPPRPSPGRPRSTTATVSAKQAAPHHQRAGPAG